MSQNNSSRYNRDNRYNRGNDHSNYRRDNNYSHQRWSLTDEEHRLVYRGKDELFDKQKSFSPLPALEQKNTFSAENLFVADRWEMKELLDLKQKLNETRNRLNEKDIKVWKELTRKTNMTGAVVWGLRKQNGIEMCTNAWIKMAEIFAKYENLIPKG